MSDLVMFGDTALQLSPKGSERLATIRDAVVHARGIESGAAAAATAVGAEGTLISGVLDSPLGQRVLGQLHEHGVQTEVVRVDPDERRQGLIFREAGHPPREGSVHYDCENTALNSVDPGDLPMSLVQSAGAVFVGTSTALLSESVATTTEALLRAAKGSEVTTTIALDYREGFRSPDRYRESIAGLAEYLDVFVVRRRDAEVVFDAGGQPRKVAHSLAARFDIPIVFVVREDCSAVVLDDSVASNVVHEQPALDVDPVDTTGRQAAFVGGLLGRLARGGSLPTALTHAVATATLACTESGPLLSASRQDVTGTVDRMNERV